MKALEHVKLTDRWGGIIPTTGKIHNPSARLFYLYNQDTAKNITEHGQCIIAETLSKMFKEQPTTILKFL